MARDASDATPIENRAQLVARLELGGKPQAASAVTFSVSESCAPGRTTASETTVVTCGAALAIVVSDASPQFVTTASIGLGGGDRLAVGVVARRRQRDRRGGVRAVARRREACPSRTACPRSVIASRVGNGPHSSTLTVAASLPSPVTTAVSVICAPGAVSCALIWVVIARRAADRPSSPPPPRTRSRTPAIVSLSAIDSR